MWSLGGGLQRLSVILITSYWEGLLSTRFIIDNAGLLNTWLKVVRSLHWEVTLPFPFLRCTLEENHCAQLILKGWELCSTSLRGQYLHKLFGIFLCVWFVFLLVYLFSHLFISVWTQGYLFYTFGHNPIPHYLFCWLNCLRFGHWSSFSWLLCPFDIPPVFYFGKHFLSSWRCKVFQAHLV